MFFFLLCGKIKKIYQRKKDHSKGQGQEQEEDIGQSHLADTVVFNKAFKSLLNNF